MDTAALAAAVGWHRGAGGAIMAGRGYEWPAYWYDRNGRQQHPAITDPFANLVAFNPQWRQPRRVDVWWWMELEVFDVDGTMIRGTRISWNRNGTGYFKIAVDFEREGYGFNCFPAFRVLSDAQAYAEGLMLLSLEEVMRVNESQWPGVVL